LITFSYGLAVVGEVSVQPANASAAVAMQDVASVRVIWIPRLSDPSARELKRFRVQNATEVRIGRERPSERKETREEAHQAPLSSVQARQP
jgi:hypothetical protein